MPEGDTIFRSARAMQRVLAGRQVTGFETALAKLASTDDNTPIAGRTIERVESRGKWLLVHLSGDLILVTHMLMSGSWHLYRTGERWRMPHRAMRVVLRTAEWEAVAFNVPVAEFYTARTLARHPQIPALGPDILSQQFTAAIGIERIAAYVRQNPEAEVGAMLLNQRVLAGLGNVYKSEVTFAARVHPFRQLATLTRDEIERMVEFAERYMKANVNDGSGDRIVTYSGNRRTTHRMDREERLWVYGRQGQECRRCGGLIMMRRQGTAARSTYWCPHCQPWQGNGAEPVGNTTPLRRGRIGC